MPSLPDSEASPKQFLDAQVRESFGRVVYSHKAHEKNADILRSKLSTIRIAQILLAAFSTGGFVTTLVGTGTWGSLVGAICSALLLTLNLYSRSHNLSLQAEEHRNAAIQVWYMREKHLSLITDLAIDIDPLSAMIDRRDQLIEELRMVYEKCPSTSNKAYRAAHRALNLREEMTFAPSEVDNFLPPELRHSTSL